MRHVKPVWPDWEAGIDFKFPRIVGGKELSKSALLCNSSFLLRFQVSLKKKRHNNDIGLSTLKGDSITFPPPLFHGMSTNLTRKLHPFFFLSRVSLSSSSWTCLLKNRGIVLFIASLGEVFEPLEDTNIGMRNMQELFFGWVGWDGTVWVLNVFIFVTEKSITFKKRKYRRNTEKNRIYLNSHRHYLIYCLYCLNTSRLKWDAPVLRLLLSPLQPLFGLVTQLPLFPFERERVAWRFRMRLRLLPFLQQRENQNFSSTVSYLKNIIPRNFITKSKLKLCYTFNRP